MADFIRLLHVYNMLLVLLTGSITGIWGLVLYFRKKTASKSWNRALITTGIVGALQGLFGILLVILGQKPGNGVGNYYLHYVYGGIVALIFVIAMSFTTSGKDKRRDLLIYSLASLVLVAAAVRALSTGPSAGIQSIQWTW